MALQVLFGGGVWSGKSNYVFFALMPYRLALYFFLMIKK